MSSEMDIVYHARKFAELVMMWGRDGVQVFGHELVAAAQLMLDRIELEETK